MSTLWLLASKTWQSFGLHNCSQMAAAISYYVLFAIVPLTIFGVSVLGMVASDETQERIIDEVTEEINAGAQNVVIELNEESREQLVAQFGDEGVAEIEDSLNALDSAARLDLAEELDEGEEVTIDGRSLSADELVVQTDNLIADIVSDVVTASPALSVISLITTAVAAAVMFGAVRRSLNVVWGAQPRPFAQQRLLEVGMMLGALVFLLLSIGASAAVQSLRESWEGSANPFALPDGPLWAVLGFIVPWAMSFGLFLVLFLTVPNTSTKFRDVWLGALLSTTLFEALKFGFSIYAANFANYGAVYGTLGGILLFMLFTYFAAYFLLMGAELAVQHGEWRAGRVLAEEPASAERQSLWDTAISAARGLFVARKQ
jgi:YihY family inner membrane protein